MGLLWLDTSAAPRSCGGGTETETFFFSSQKQAKVERLICTHKKAIHLVSVCVLNINVVKIYTFVIFIDIKDGMAVSHTRTYWQSHLQGGLHLAYFLNIQIIIYYPSFLSHTKVFLFCLPEPTGNLNKLCSHARGIAELCATKRLPNPIYEVFEHSGGSIPMAPSPSSIGAAGGSGNAPALPSHFGQSWYSCVVSVGGRDYETSYVYRAEENAKEKAAKKAYEALNSAG